MNTSLNPPPWTRCLSVFSLGIFLSALQRSGLAGRTVAALLFWGALGPLWADTFYDVTTTTLNVGDSGDGVVEISGTANITGNVGIGSNLTVDFDMQAQSVTSSFEVFFGMELTDGATLSVDNTTIRFDGGNSSTDWVWRKGSTPLTVMSLATNGSLTLYDNSTSATLVLNPNSVSLTNIANGNTSAPALRFTGNSSNTGIYSPAEDKIGFVVNGTEKVHIAANGNVTIGGNFDADKLFYVHGDAKIFGELQVNGLLNMTTNKITSLGQWAANNAAIQFYADADTGIYSPGSDQIALTSGGVATVVVDSSQRVGIGTLTPSAKLTVNGTLTASGNASLGANLTVTGNSSLTGNATIGANLTVTGASTLNGNTTVAAPLSVTANATFDTSSTVTVSGPLIVSNTTTVSGATTFSGSIDVSGNSTTTFSENTTLNVNGPMQFGQAYGDIGMGDFGDPP